MRRARGPGARVVLAQPLHWLPFGMGLGLLPRAPGTWASLATVLAVWWLPPLSVGTQLALVGLLFVAGVVLCGASARRLGVHDHPGIVFDEIVAMLAVLVFTPRAPLWFLAAFLLFRLFDIWKPWPIRELDHRLGGGAGIMLDDVLAAVFAVALLWPATRWLPMPA